jgi:hypothetical protein
MRITAIVLAWLITAVTAYGEDFRIHTKVYKGDETTPASQNLTLFRGGVVYDFLSDPTETTIFDRPRAGKPGRFLLLDPARQVQAEVPLDRLHSFMSQLQLWAAGQSDPFLRFLSLPQFNEQLDEEHQSWSYSSRFMNYRVKADAVGEEQFQQYDEFADWFVRLNTMLSIKTRPPYGLGRLAVNASLRSRREIPSEVTLTVDSPNRFLKRVTTFRSEHQLTALISQTDQARIDEAATQLVSFKKVTLEDYLQPAEK